MSSRFSWSDTEVSIWFYNISILWWLRKYLRMSVHWFVWWPIVDSLSVPPSFPLSLPFSLPLSLSVTVPALFTFSVSVPGPLTVFPPAAVVRGRLGAPLQWQMFLSVTRNLTKKKQGHDYESSQTVMQCKSFSAAISHILLRPWWGSSCILLAGPDKT